MCLVPACSCVITDWRCNFNVSARHGCEDEGIVATAIRPIFCGVVQLFPAVRHHPPRDGLLSAGQSPP